MGNHRFWVGGATPVGNNGLHVFHIFLVGSWMSVKYAILLAKFWGLQSVPFSCLHLCYYIIHDIWNPGQVIGLSMTVIQTQDHFGW